MLHWFLRWGDIPLGWLDHIPKIFKGWQVEDSNNMIVYTLKPILKKLMHLKGHGKNVGLLQET